MTRLKCEVVMGKQTDGESSVQAGCAPNPQLLWEEYKHRHEHCWKTLFQVTYAVVLISLVPYTKPEIVKVLKWWIVLVPALATGLAVLGLCRLRRELKRFDRINKAHLKLQLELQGFNADDGKSTFKRDFTLYLSLLIAAAAANGALLLLIWAPSVR
jgi:hypothetical protein